MEMEFTGLPWLAAGLNSRIVNVVLLVVAESAEKTARFPVVKEARPVTGAEHANAAAKSREAVLILWNDLIRFEFFTSGLSFYGLSNIRNKRSKSDGLATPLEWPGNRIARGHRSSIDDIGREINFEIRPVGPAMNPVRHAIGR
jgi:hypothetical protein